MRTKNLVNDQSGDGEHLAALTHHYAVLREAVRQIGLRLGLESGSTASGSSGSGSQDGV